MDGARVRLVFDDRHVLSKSQKSEGLKRSWFLLRPEHESISDLSSHLLHAFDLHHSCPHGLLLSMDGFVLPPFESTCILKDKDIISVKKKRGKLLRDAVDAIEDVDIVEKQPVDNGVLLLANEEFEKESGGYKSESEEDEDEDQLEEILHAEDLSAGNAVSKKRKASKKLQSPKKKKQRSVVRESIESDDLPEQTEQNRVIPKKNLHKEEVPDVKSKPNMSCSPESGEISNGDVETLPSVNRSVQIQERGKGSEDVNHVPEDTEKVPSRSARRKKAKRKWLREMAKIGKEEVVCHSNGFLNWKQEPAKAKKKELNRKPESAKAKKKEVVRHSKGLLHRKQPAEKDMAKNNVENEEPNKESDADDDIIPILNRTQEPAEAKKEVVCHSKGLLHWKQSAENDITKNTVENEQPNQKSDSEDDVVPVVIRPGHIRFENPGKDRDVHRSEVSMETFQWNGTTSKKKGQKWGTEKLSFSQRSGYKDLNKEHSEPLNIEKEKPANDPTDFDKLPLLTGLPKEGDVISYCLLELSSSYTPEISSIRVGKVSWYNPESKKVMLMPVPEYPIVSEKSDEDYPPLQVDDSPYGEDGSLEFDFSSLLDVRVVKHSNLDPTKTVADGASEGLAGNTNPMSNVMPSTSDKQTPAPTPTPENGEVDPWDQLSEVLNDKKAELSQSKESGRNPWSYRALRSSALGPTMALLRSKNAI